MFSALLRLRGTTNVSRFEDSLLLLCSPLLAQDGSANLFCIDPWEIRRRKKGEREKKKRKKEKKIKKGKVVLFETWRRQVYRSCLQSLLIAGKPRGQERKSRTIRLNQ